jgi:hypothetical protein
MKLIETPAFKFPNNLAALQSDASSAEEDLIPATHQGDGFPQSHSTPR